MFREVYLKLLLNILRTKRCLECHAWYRQIFLDLKRTIYKNKNNEFVKNRISLKKCLFISFLKKCIHVMCPYNILVIQKITLVASL